MGTRVRLHHNAEREDQAGWRTVNGARWWAVDRARRWALYGTWPGTLDGPMRRFVNGSMPPGTTLPF